MGKPVPVYFEFDFIKQCFLDCPFMEILDKRPEERETFGSWLINGNNDCPDYIHVYREVTKRFPLYGDLPHTYIDKAEEIKAPKYNTLFIRGSGSERKAYLDSKMPKDEYYIEYFAKNLSGDYTEAFTGSQIDLDRSNGLFDSMIHYTDNIRMSLALIREADFIVTNDSGLAHAAAAMNKPMTILWKNTSLPKNANPNKNCRYKMVH